MLVAAAAPTQVARRPPAHGGTVRRLRLGRVHALKHPARRYEPSAGGKAGSGGLGAHKRSQALQQPLTFF